MPELPTINRQYAVENIAGLYRAGTGNTYQDGTKVIRRWTGRGDTYVTIELASGEHWKLGRKFVRPEGPPIYSVEKIQRRNDESAI